MKKTFLFLILIFTTFLCFGQIADPLDGKRYFGYFYEGIEFENNDITIDSPEPEYCWFETGSFPYRITVDNDLSYLIINKASKEYRYLMIYNDDLILLYDADNSSAVFYGASHGWRSIESHFWGPEQEKWFDSSSSLTERGYEYKPSNLALFNTKEPWVEGAEGYGIGEKIYLHNCGSSLVILNGFYSYNKPYLWRENSRVKKIKIHFVNNPEIEDKEFELQDTTELQKIIVFPDEYINPASSGREIVIEILDVYKGSKYQDTCINGIMVSCIP